MHSWLVQPVLLSLQIWLRYAKRSSWDQSIRVSWILQVIYYSSRVLDVFISCCDMRCYTVLAVKYYPQQKIFLDHSNNYCFTVRYIWIVSEFFLCTVLLTVQAARYDSWSLLGASFVRESFNSGTYRNYINTKWKHYIYSRRVNEPRSHVNI